jgi:peptide/nickel transport system permease protein
MFAYVIRRLIISIPIMLGVTIIVFVLASQMPGDAVAAMISTETPMADELIALRRGQLGLDLPVPVQYMNWLGQLLQGNLGFSFQTGEPVAQMIFTRAPATLQLMGTALIIAIILGTILGVISALRQYSWIDYTLTLGGFIGISIPDFFLGLLLIYVFALQLGWFPTSGIATAGEPYSLADNLRHLFLPALALALVRTATFIRYTRASVLEVMNNDFVRTARAKGLNAFTVTGRHILRNALIPLITVIGLAIPALFAGSVVIELVFQWPGIGMMFITSVTNRDSPIIMGYVLVLAVLVLIANLLTDLTYSLVDPRIRYD